MWLSLRLGVNPNRTSSKTTRQENCPGLSSCHNPRSYRQMAKEPVFALRILAKFARYGSLCSLPVLTPTTLS